MIGTRTRTIVIGVVTAVWAANFIAGVAVKGYQPSESINGIFMAIVGGLFALGAKGGGSSHQGEPPAAPPAPIEPPPPQDPTTTSLSQPQQPQPPQPPPTQGSG